MIHTQIQVKKTTREALKSLKLVNRESYDSVINRIVNKKEVNNNEGQNDR